MLSYLLGTHPETNISKWINLKYLGGGDAFVPNFLMGQEWDARLTALDWRTTDSCANQWAIISLPHGSSLVWPGVSLVWMQWLVGWMWWLIDLDVMAQWQRYGSLFGIVAHIVVAHWSENGGSLVGCGGSLGEASVVHLEGYCDFLSRACYLTCMSVMTHWRRWCVGMLRLLVMMWWFTGRIR